MNIRSKTITIATTLFALATASSIASAAQGKHEKKFCSDLGALKQDLTRLDAIGPESTIKEFKAALKKTSDDAKTAEKEARKIKSPAAKQFSQAADQLSNETRKIPDNMTLAQVRSRIEGDVRNVKESAHALASEAGCPEAMGTEGMTKPHGGMTEPQGTKPEGTKPEGMQPQGTQPQGGTQPYR